MTRLLVTCFSSRDAVKVMAVLDDLKSVKYDLLIVEEGCLDENNIEQTCFDFEIYDECGGISPQACMEIMQKIMYFDCYSRFTNTVK